MFQTNNPALVVIDCQVAIDHFSASGRSNPDAEIEISKLLELWRARGLPIIHVRHSSKSLKSPYHSSKETYEFKPEVFPRPDESIITKSENCAFVDTSLHQELKSLNSSELVICGVLTHHSIDATVRYACAVGFRVTVPSNATASFPIAISGGKVISSDLVQDIYLSNLNGEYCQVVENVSM